ncbi:hypothetical protein GWO43_12730 [candidate division KSB1 bacterium]|nr:hypothetical protein [candidate division KSB1 bacterium]NIR71288.1 hypothetical protein [candidate division KSB1 bacterium]NIS24817.1 hypothetical protein [candidate division KSB1 bacterium]NIT71724.1 hypothetical protein [candidate division KSB1 bacterium]NIU25453.1 hypothetical protein [candidate division KSB1 bacterium]
MRTIRISQEVWNAIAERGKFGETPDDVLRRVFKIKPNDRSNSRNRRTNRRMSAKVEHGELSIVFSNGPSKRWPLPLKDDKKELRIVRDTAVAFAEEHGATDGQLKALLKAINSAGYYLTK